MAINTAAIAPDWAALFSAAAPLDVPPAILIGGAAAAAVFLTLSGTLLAVAPRQCHAAIAVAR